MPRLSANLISSSNRTSNSHRYRYRNRNRITNRNPNRGLVRRRRSSRRADAFVPLFPRGVKRTVQDIYAADMSLGQEEREAPPRKKRAVNIVFTDCRSSLAGVRGLIETPSEVAERELAIKNAAAKALETELAERVLAERELALEAAAADVFLVEEAAFVASQAEEIAEIAAELSEKAAAAEAIASAAQLAADNAKLGVRLAVQAISRAEDAYVAARTRAAQSAAASDDAFNTALCAEQATLAYLGVGAPYSGSGAAYAIEMAQEAATRKKVAAITANAAHVAFVATVTTRERVPVAESRAKEAAQAAAAAKKMAEKAYTKYTGVAERAAIVAEIAAAATAAIPKALPMKASKWMVYAGAVIGYAAKKLLS
ncbi:hypothetical protein F4703DRAFT_1855472 [Phycomyces blakesleeanus]